MRRPAAFLPLFALLTVCVGCGGVETPRSAGTSRPRTGRAPGLAARSPGASRPVQASEVKYQGWNALRLSNGIITVVAVPDIGGRVMEYKLKAHPFLWVNPAEFGKLHGPPQTEAERTWHNYGGYKAWPAPQERWHGPPDPLGSALDGGRWKGEIGPREPGRASIRLVSPADANVTGLQITREVILHGDSTRLTVRETFKNVGDKPITWSVWDVTQVPGSLGKGAKFSPDARVYFPLNPASKFGQGYYDMLDGGSDQWLKDVAPGIMGVKYLNKTGKIGADSAAGWITYVDEQHDYTYAKRFKVERGAEYPDKGATVEVYTSGGDTSYMEVEVLSPLRVLKPAETFSFTVDWYAARSGGPTLSCTDVGVVQKPLDLGDAKGQLTLTGTFGVFLPGTLEVVFQDNGGREISTTASIPADPDKVVELTQPVNVPAGAARVALQAVNTAGTPVGILAAADLGPGGSVVRAVPSTDSGGAT